MGWSLLALLVPVHIADDPAQLRILPRIALVVALSLHVRPVLQKPSDPGMIRVIGAKQSKVERVNKRRRDRI